MQPQTINQDECADSPAPTICTLIQTAEAEKERERQETTARLNATIAEAKKATREQLGDLWSEIEPLGISGTRWIYSTDRNGEFERIRYELNPDSLSALGLAPFHVVAAKTRSGAYPRTGEWNVFFREVREYQPREQDVKDAAAFFFAMHQRVLDEQKKERDERIEVLTDKLSLNQYKRVHTRAEAQQVLDELLALDPANASTYQQMHAELTAAWDKRKRELEAEERATKERKAKEAAQAAELQALAAEYRTAYESYWEQLHDLRAHNLEVKARWQDLLDRDTFDVWTLEYALVAEQDESDERVIETRTAYLVNGSVTNAWGEYQVLQKGGETVLKRFAHEVSVEAAQAWKPSEHKQYAVKIEVYGAKFYLAHTKKHDQFTIAEQIQREIQHENALAKPPAPESLETDYGIRIGESWIENAKSIRRAVRDAKPLADFADPQDWD